MTMQKLKNRGSVLMGLLMVILIIAMLWLIDLTAMFGPMDKNRRFEERPWFEEKRLLEKDALPVKQTGKRGKVVIKDETILSGPVERKNEGRGNIEIVIEPNGLAKGHWQCAYKYPDSSYNISADFKGNIDPTKTFEDPKGTSKQLLYFITKGKYKQLKSDEKTGNQWPSEDIIYVVGWIDKDYSAKGKLFLMEGDVESHGNADYNWKTIKNEQQNADKNK
jgi:hypothetical protein